MTSSPALLRKRRRGEYAKNYIEDCEEDFLGPNFRIRIKLLFPLCGTIVLLNTSQQSPKLRTEKQEVKK